MSATAVTSVDATAIPLFCHKSKRHRMTSMRSVVSTAAQSITVLVLVRHVMWLSSGYSLAV